MNKMTVEAPDNKFDIMMTLHFNNKENSNLPKNQSMGGLPSDDKMSGGGNVASKDETSGRNTNRNSSVSVDSNLSFEFAETQEPCVSYKFEY